MHPKKSDDKKFRIQPEYNVVHSMLHVLNEQTVRASGTLLVEKCDADGAKCKTLCIICLLLLLLFK